MNLMILHFELISKHMLIHPAWVYSEHTEFVALQRNTLEKLCEMWTGNVFAMKSVEYLRLRQIAEHFY